MQLSSAFWFFMFEATPRSDQSHTMTWSHGMTKLPYNAIPEIGTKA